MGIILGFGPYHVDLTKEFLQKMGKEIIQHEFGNAKPIAHKMAKELGAFKDKYEYVNIRKVHEWSDFDGHRAAVVEGIYWHYRDDHPLSPDGFAAFGIPFCLTVQEDSIWGERVYVAV